MSEKIRECPCCGGAGEAVRWQRDGYAFAFVKCVGACRLAGHEVYVVGGKMDEAINKAVASWNHRPREERLVKLLREAREHVNRTTLSCVDRHLGDAGCPIGHCYRIGSETCDARDLLAAIDAELGRET